MCLFNFFRNELDKDLELHLKHLSKPLWIESSPKGLASIEGNLMVGFPCGNLIQI